VTYSVELHVAVLATLYQLPSILKCGLSVGDSSSDMSVERRRVICSWSVLSHLDKHKDLLHCLAETEYTIEQSNRRWSISSINCLCIPGYYCWEARDEESNPYPVFNQLIFNKRG